mmetsp:Transcript_129505/g.242257  ORF Transcript_129505/g.242257 Transcript_129505/m.242257 type:complete len:391 (-) Transcript_129505:31-1203(-)
MWKPMGFEGDSWAKEDKGVHSASGNASDQTFTTAPQFSTAVRVDVAGCREALLRLVRDLDEQCGSSASAAAREPREASPDMLVQVQAAFQGAAEIRALLSVKAPPLRQQAAQLSEELNHLSAEAGQQTVMAERCVEDLLRRAEAMCSQVREAKRESASRAEAMSHRQAVLQEEVRVLEQRGKVGALTGATNGPSWVSADAEKRKKLQARIMSAEARQAAAAKVTQDQKLRCEERLAGLRQERQELEACAAATNSSMWRSRFEALVAAQNALADRAATFGPDVSRERLDQALAAASAAAAAAGGPASREGQSSATPEFLMEAVRCVCGLAEAERRRGGLLVERWRELHGNDSCRVAEGLGSIAPADRGFSPSRAYDWDLDAWRTAQKACGE